MTDREGRRRFGDDSRCGAGVPAGRRAVPACPAPGWRTSTGISSSSHSPLDPSGSVGQQVQTIVDGRLSSCYATTLLAEGEAPVSHRWQLEDSAGEAGVVRNEWEVRRLRDREFRKYKEDIYESQTQIL